MRRRHTRALCIIALLVAFAPSFLALADDLDTLLTQPPSASLTSEDAAHRIELLRGLIAEHPDREAEIEAYLIPFIRATQPPPEKPMPTPAPPPAQAKPLLLLKQPDGTMSAMRASSYRKQGAVVMIVTDKGSHAVLQALTVQGELPWYTETELESGAVDLNILAERYEAFVKAMPALGSVLKADIMRLRKMQKERDDAVAAKENAEQTRLAKATVDVYDPASGYTAATLAALLLKAEKARNDMPEFAEKIDEWAAPFREHFTKLLTGHSFVNGEWVSNKTLARKALEKQQAAFMSSLDYQVGAEPFPPGAARGMVTVPLAGTAFALAAGVALIVTGRRRTYLFGAGVALLAIAPFPVARAFFLATRTPLLLSSTIPMADEQPIVDVLSQAAGLEDVAAAPREISTNALNGFLARHVQLAPASAKSNDASARQAVAVLLLPGGIAVFEMIRCAGLNWIVRLDLEFRRAGGKPEILLSGAKIGALDCPSGFADALWKNLEPQFAEILSSSRISGRFAVQPPEDGRIGLEPHSTPATGAK